MKKTLESRYGAEGLITPAQYITEFVCEKKAKRDLPDKFWQLPEWKSYFQNQVVAANALLKIYSVKAILRAIADPRLKNLYSLRNPFLDKIIEEKEREIKLQEQAPVTVVVEENKEWKPTTPSTKKSPLSMLKEVEDEQEEIT